MLQNLPLDTISIVIQYLNLQEVRICVSKVNKYLQYAVQKLEQRECSTPHTFLHQISKCTCQVFPDFSKFCNQIFRSQPLWNKLDRINAIKAVHKQMNNVVDWNNVVIKSYVNNGNPYISTCTNPYIVSCVASKNSCELELLMKCYTLYGIQGLKTDFLFAFSCLK
jgi:hypothetical protein